MTTHPIMRMCHGLLVLLLCTPACSISFHRVNHWDEAFWFGDEPVTMTKSLHVDAPADASRVSITITVGCTAGTLAWSLVDPVGVERDRQVVRLGSHESQANWPVLALFVPANLGLAAGVSAWVTSSVIQSAARNP